MNERFVRSLRFWMRAYPPRWRAARGEELFGLVVDLAGPGTLRLGWRRAFDLARGGLATRWRGHPPLLTWLAYRLLNRRIPRAFRAWALDDISGSWYPLRRFLTYWWGLLWLAIVVSGPNWQRPGGIAVPVLIVFMRMSAGSARRAAAVQHVAAQPGESLHEGSLVAQDGPQPRTTARWALPWVSRVLGFASVTSVAVAFLAQSAAAEVCLAAALGLGLIGGWVALSRLSRFVGLCVDQPHRTLRAGSGEDIVVLILLTGCVVDSVPSDLLGGGSLVLSIGIGVAALALLPGTLVALGFARRLIGADLTGSDIWSIAAFGELPPVDPLIPEVRPLTGPVAEGAVVPPAPPEPIDDTPYPALP
jgi:hypothetical protein